MKLGAMNNPGEEVTAQVSFIASNGFEFVELAIEAPEATPELLKEKEQELRDILESYKVEVVAHLPWYFEIAHPYTRVRDAFLEEVRSALEVAAAFDAQLAGVHLHRLPKFFREKQQEMHISALHQALAFAEEVGIKLCIENLDLRSFPAESVAKVLEALPELGLVLDVGHAHIGATNEEVLSFIHAFQKRILHVHAHDNNLREDLHLPIGAGAIEWERILPELKSFYDGRVTLEIHSRDSDYLLISRKKFLKLWNQEAGR
jgi:sugar phosphate isomerase/epimerase